MDALKRSVLNGDGTDIAKRIVSHEQDAALALASYDNEDFSGRFSVKSSKGRSVYCFEVDGKEVDFSKKLSALELELADNINSAFDNCKTAVSRAFDYFEGDIQRFVESDVCTLLLHQRISKALETYNPKLTEHGLSATALMGLTAKKISENYQGKEELIPILSKLRGAMVSQVHRVKTTFMPFLQSTWGSCKTEADHYKYFDLLPVDWTATPLSVTTVADDEDGIREEEVRKEEEEEEELEAVHDAEKPKDSVIETDAAHSERVQEEDSNKLFEATALKDTPTKEPSQSAKPTEFAVSETVKEMEDCGVSKELKKTTNILPAVAHSLKSISTSESDYKKSQKKVSVNLQSVEKTEVLVGSRVIPAACQESLAIYSPPGMQAAEHFGERSISARLPGKGSAVLQKTRSDFEVEAARKIQTAPNELTVLQGFGTYSFANFCYRIGSNCSSSRNLGISPITVTYPVNARRENTVLAFQYPANETTTGIFINRNEIYQVPRFVPNDQAFFITINGIVIFGNVTQIFGLKCVKSNDTELRATATDNHGLIMDPHTVAGTPYKFEDRSINVFHKNGDTIIILHNDNYLLSVVKNDLCDDDPLKMTVTCIKGLTKDIDGSFSVVLEDLNVLRWICFSKTVQVRNMSSSDEGDLDAVFVNDLVYKTVQGLVSSFTQVEITHNWPVFADIVGTYSMFSLEDDLPGTKHAQPFLRISPTIRIKNQSEDTVAGFNMESSTRLYLQQNLQLPAMVPKGRRVFSIFSTEAETVDKYSIKDGKLIAHFASKRFVELPSAHYSVPVQRFRKLFTATNGQRLTGFLLGVRGNKVHVLFPGSRSWNYLPEGTSVSSPHNGVFNSFSLQVLTFPSMNSLAKFVTPFNDGVELSVKKRPTAVFKPLSESFVAEANAAFPKLGDQLSNIQKVLAIWCKKPNDANMIQVQEYLNGFSEIIIVQGTGRQLKGTGLMVTEDGASEGTVLPVQKAKKGNCILEDAPQSAYQFLRKQKLHHNEQIIQSCSSLLEFTRQKFIELNFPTNVQTNVYAWKATIFSVHHDSPDEAFKMLSEAHPTVFCSILLSGFTSFFKDFKDNLAQFKRSFQDAVQNLAKKKIEGDSVKEIKKDVSDLDDTDSDLDDTDFANAIDKLSHHDDPDLGDLGPTYLQGLRENAASKAPRKQFKQIKNLVKYKGKTPRHLQKDDNYLEKPSGGPAPNVFRPSVLAAKEREGEKLAHNMFIELRSLVLKRLEKNKHHETLPPECISFAGMSGSQNFEDALDRFTCGLSARMLPSLQLEDYGDQVINDEKYAAFMAFRETEEYTAHISTVAQDAKDETTLLESSFMLTQPEVDALIARVTHEVENLLIQQNHKNKDLPSNIVFANIRGASDPKDAVNRFTQLLMARNFHLTDDSEIQSPLLPLTEFKVLLAPTTEDGLKETLQYETLVLQVLNRMTVFERHTLLSEVRGTLASFLREGNLPVEAVGILLQLKQGHDNVNAEEVTEDKTQDHKRSSDSELSEGKKKKQVKSNSQDVTQSDDNETSAMKKPRTEDGE